MSDVYSQSEQETRLVRSILRWYSKHRRDLPWRKTRNPYRILVSEVMLQQTQVDRVVPKYREFLRRFPHVSALARAPRSEVITLWAGLGYNRRALYLKDAAAMIVNTYRGSFPKNIDALKQLPGIGEYTARAILSFSFDQPVAVLDTNHRQFYRRIFFGGKEASDAELLVRAEKVIDILQSFSLRECRSISARGSLVYHWNQAIMDVMSAAANAKNEDPFIRAFCVRYPMRSVRRKKKKSIPFRETDRYIRGQILNYLRASRGVDATGLRSLFREIERVRYKNILIGLEKDGLIVKEKKRILLPE